MLREVEKKIKLKVKKRLETVMGIPNSWIGKDLEKLQKRAKIQKRNNRQRYADDCVTALLHQLKEQPFGF